MRKQESFLDYHQKGYCNPGAVYAQMGRYSKAIWAFREALRLNPDDRVAQQNLKMAYDKSKEQKSEVRGQRSEVGGLRAESGEQGAKRIERRAKS